MSDTVIMKLPHRMVILIMKKQYSIHLDMVCHIRHSSRRWVNFLQMEILSVLMLLLQIQEKFLEKRLFNYTILHHIQKVGIEKSHVVLAAFDKTDVLKPGESQTLTLSFMKEDMASYELQRCQKPNGSGKRGLRDQIE